MKVDSDVLENLIDKVTCGADYDDDFIIEFKEDKVVTGVQFSTILMIRAELSSEVFSNYEAIGKVGIPSPKRMTKVLSRLKGKMQIKKEGSTISFKDQTGKSSQFTIADPDFIDDERQDGSLDYEDNTKDRIKRKTLTDVVKDAKALKLSSSGQSADIYLITEDGKLSSRVETQDGDFKIENSVNTTIKNDQSVLINPEYFDKMVDSLDDEKVTVRLQDDFPLTIEEKAGKMKTNYVLAPKIEE